MVTESLRTVSSTSRPASTGHLVNCRIESSPNWLPWASGEKWKEICAALHRSIACWLDALQLPVDVRFEWRAERTAEWPGETVCRLMFDDRDSIFVYLPKESVNVETIAGRLASGVFDARASLVTESVTQHLLLARELVDRGLRPRRAWDLEVPLNSDAAESHYDRLIDHEVALRVKVPNLTQLTDQPGEEEPLSKLLELMDDGLFYELGLMLPPVEVDEDSSLAPTAVQIWINDMPLPVQTGLAVGEMLVNDTPDRLKLIGITQARAAVNPANGNPSSIVEASDVNIKAVKDARLTNWGPAGYIVLVLSAAVRRYAGALWTIDSTDAALFLLREAFEPLIRAFEQRFDPNRRLLTPILRNLLDEEISVRNLSAIVESMLAIDSVSSMNDRELIAFPPAAGNVIISDRVSSVSQLQINDWVTAVRIRLARYISHKHTRGQSTLIVYLLDPKIEEELEATSSSSAYSLFSPEGHLRLFRAINAKIATPDARAVILTTKTVRRTLRDLISKDLPNVTVLCYQELSPEMSIQPVARITWC